MPTLNWRFWRLEYVDRKLWNVFPPQELALGSDLFNGLGLAGDGAEGVDEGSIASDSDKASANTKSRR